MFIKIPAISAEIPPITIKAGAEVKPKVEARIREIPEASNISITNPAPVLTISPSLFP